MLFSTFATALIDQNLLQDAVSLGLVLDEPDLQATAQQIRQEFLDILVIDRLLGLVFIAGLGGERIGDQDQGILDIGKGDFGFIILVLVLQLGLAVEFIDQGITHGFVRRAAIFQPARVMVILDQVDLIIEAQSHSSLDLVFRLVGAIAALAAAFKKKRARDALLLVQLADKAQDAFWIVEFLGGAGWLVKQAEGHSGIDDGLAFQSLLEIVQRDHDVSENVPVCLPFLDRAGLLLPDRGLGQATDIIAFFEVQIIAEAIAHHRYVEVFGSILGGTGAQAIETEAELIMVPADIVVFAASIQFAVDQLPIVAVFLLIEIERNAATLVFDLERSVAVALDLDQVAMSFPGLVDGIRQDLEKGMLAALQVVGTKNNTWPEADPVSPLQGGYAGIVVGFAFGHGNSCSAQNRFIIAQAKRAKNRTAPLFKGAVLASLGGLEPPTHSLEGCCSIQLSYRPMSALPLT